MDKCKLLEYVGTIQVPAISGQFVAKERFQLNHGDDGRVKFRSFGHRFTEQFLSGDGKKEEPIDGRPLHYSRVLHDSLPHEILARLGSGEVAEVTLMAVHFLLESQKGGESGTLLVNGQCNTFFVRNVNGIFLAVSACWSGSGWAMGAASLEISKPLNYGGYVFHPNRIESTEILVPSKV